MQTLEFPQLTLSTACERGGIERDDKVLLALEISGADCLSKSGRKGQIRQWLSNFRHGHSLFNPPFTAARAPPDAIMACYRAPCHHPRRFGRHLSAQNAPPLLGLMEIPHPARDGMVRDRTKCAAVLAVPTIVTKQHELILAGRPFVAIAGIRP